MASIISQSVSDIFLQDIVGLSDRKYNFKGMQINQKISDFVDIDSIKNENLANAIQEGNINRIRAIVNYPRLIRRIESGHENA